ncbi:MAG TPA: DNA mismatch repair endonuclease MutL [Thermodesulfobacteriota bacterium]|nr:DNA mismatch repair endonuclease MutL [Thermodesulfobacteriota bacterium]
MGKIRLLPDELVSKIAAGEIVERPASVVKELIENSLDAGSTLIRLDVRAGGKRLISVSDNGEGMTRDDALLSLERHATSKIREIKDLFSIKTLGFRGEALPSIAGVSRFRLTSRTRGEIVGVRISVNGGTLKSVEEIGCPEGTTVEVANLFYNTPARLKFMKSDETELSNILDIVQREALSHTDVGFECLHEGRMLIQLPARKTVRERLSEIFPDTELFEVRAESDGIRVFGYMGGPQDARSTAQRLYTYVNGRAVRDRFLSRMMIDSYGRLIDKGKFPQGVLFVEAPADEIDINVHPTKNEVRFRRSRMVGDLIKSSVMSMLRDAPWIKGYHQRVENAVRSFYEGRDSLDYTSTKLTMGASPHESRSSIVESKDSLKLHSNERLNLSDEGPADSMEPEAQALFGKRGFFSSLEILGQLGRLYIVCASKEGMILIDQHAAHERVNYERLKNAYLKRKGLENQELLIPLTIDLSPQEEMVLSKHKEDLESLGIKLEEFGNGSFVVRSIPSILKNADVEGIMKDVIGELSLLEEERSLDNKVDHLISTMACHSSVRANDWLNREKMIALLEDLDRAEFPHSCPHGRPVAREITFEELEKMFKRS